MPTVVTNEFKFQEGGGNVDLSASTWVCSLMGDIVTSSSDALRGLSNWYTGTSAVSGYEASGTGYTSGVTLANIGWYDDPADNIQKLSADDVSWSAVSIQSYGASIWRTDDGLVMGFVDFGLQTTSNGDFVINWNSGGILNKI